MNLEPSATLLVCHQCLVIIATDCDRCLAATFMWSQVTVLDRVPVPMGREIWRDRIGNRNHGQNMHCKFWPNCYR